MLQRWPGYSVAALAQHLDMSERTVFRYLQLLETVGYATDVREGRYFLVEAPAWTAQQLTTAEAELLRRRLADLGSPPDPLLASLRLKLQLTPDPLPLPEELSTLARLRLLELLQTAIDQRRRVRLHDYRSTNSPATGPREVEPVTLSDNFAQLVALDVPTQEKRVFNLERMGRVELLDEPCTLPVGDLRPDLFGMAHTDWQPAELQLTERAYQLLIREYPAALSYCQPTGRTTWPHRFQAPIRGFEGIGRFVMGLPTETQVTAPDTLRAFVRKKSAQADW